MSAYCTNANPTTSQNLLRYLYSSTISNLQSQKLHPPYLPHAPGTAKKLRQRHRPHPHASAQTRGNRTLSIWLLLHQRMLAGALPYFASVGDVDGIWHVAGTGEVDEDWRLAVKRHLDDGFQGAECHGHIGLGRSCSG